MVKAISKASTKSERLHLAEAIINFTKKQEEFLKSHEDLKKYSEDIFTNLDIQIDTKKSELDLLEKEYKNKSKDLEIECNQVFKEYQYEAAKKVLANRDEEPIATDELEELRDELEKLKEEFDDKLEEALKKERADSKIALSAAVANADLRHKAETAEILALSKQKEREVQVLNETIENLKHEVAEQRSLTRSVAEASKSGAITQSFGK